MPRITLVGYRGTGKSTVATLLARRLDCDWLDADAVLEARLGLTIADLVRLRGESAFRDAEAAMLRELVGSCAGVLATGGGVVLRRENRQLLREAGRPVAWLTAPATVIRARIAADPLTPQRRPALAGGDPLAEVDATLEAREPLYREVADATFDTGASSAEQVVARIVAWLTDSVPARPTEGACR